MLGMSKIWKNFRRWFVRNVVFAFRPVPVEIFFRDPYFLGDSTKRYREDLLRKVIGSVRDERGDAFMVTGSIGVGKTISVRLLTCWMIYELSQSENFRKMNGRNRRLIALFDHNLTSSQKLLLNPIKEMLSCSQYFRKKLKMRIKAESISFKNGIVVVAASPGTDSLWGEKLLGAAIEKSRIGNGYDVIRGEFLHKIAERSMSNGPVSCKRIVVSQDSYRDLAIDSGNLFHGDMNRRVFKVLKGGL